MKQYINIIGNSELDEILVNNGINLICTEDMNIQVSDSDAARIPSIVAKYAPAASGDYALRDYFQVYYADSCDWVMKKEFRTIEQAVEYCESEVKGDEEYNFSDHPDRNNHYHLEVYEGAPIDIFAVETKDAFKEPVWKSSEYYKSW